MAKDLENPTKLLEHILSHRHMKTVEPGVLTVSAYAHFYPVCYHKKNGEIAGLDVDIMKYFCKMTGLKLKLVEKEHFDGIWLDPIRGISDVAIGGIGVTKKRTRKNTNWSIPYFYVMRTLIYNKATPIQSVSKVPKHYVVRGTKGSTGWIDGKLRLPKGVTIENGKTDEQDLHDLSTGKIQGLMRGSFVGKAIIKKHKNLGMVEPWQIDPSLVSSDGEVFAYPSTCESGVSQLLSVFLTEEIFTGELKHLVKKYKLD
jgi:ABC-type amino acid transport substrate-binding protein